jgi:hypothetical protein
MIGGQGQLPKTEPANVSFWDEGDIRSLFEQALSLPQRG